MRAEDGWRTVVAVDVGGTFTDCVAWTPSGVEVAKLATSPDQSVAVVDGARRLIGGSVAGAILHGSTVATNALLERKGAATVLVTDAGFEDVLEIGRQDRPSLYDSFADRPEALVTREDRLGFGGDVSALAAVVAARRPESVAVSLAYSFEDGADEVAVGEALAGLGVPVSLSHRVVGEFREFERTSTTVLNAYLGPGVAGYLRRLQDRSSSVADRLAVMRSSGGLMPVGEASDLAAALLLSGPAGGVVAATQLGRSRGYQRVITFDMGGTSTDVCRIESGRPEVGYERTIEGFVCRMPSVAVDTVGAGGGSIAWVDPGGSLRVGPRSAGAEPGPAAYGLGGSDATVTDAHIALGTIDPGASLGGALSLDPDAAHVVLDRLGGELGMDALSVAEGILDVVEARMERAIRKVSVEQGADPRRATLVAFGGAGGLHATSLARRLGMAGVAIPPHGGVFSALGLLMAPPRLDIARSTLVAGPDGFSEAVESIAREAGRRFVTVHGDTPVSIERVVDMRYRGQSHEIAVAVEAGEGYARAVERFHVAHAEANGFSRPGDPVEAVTVRAAATGTPLMRWDDLPRLEAGPLPPQRQRTIRWGGVDVETDIWDRSSLAAGAVVDGPAIVEEEVGTTFLRPGDRGVVQSDGTLEVTW